MHYVIVLLCVLLSNTCCVLLLKLFCDFLFYISLYIPCIYYFALCFSETGNNILESLHTVYLPKWL